MIQKQNQFRLKSYIIIPFVILVALATISIIIATNRSHTEASASPKPTATAAQSQFSFNAAEAAGWRKGPSNSTSLALFSNDRSCFTSIEYKAGTVDVTAELQKSQASLAKDGYTVTPGAIVTATLKSNAGPQQYQLHQYTVSGTGSGGQLYGGNEYGYVPLSDGYLFIQGHCNTADQLPTTIPALQAIKFEESK